MIQFGTLPPGPIQNAFNILSDYLLRQESVRHKIVADVAAVKALKPELWQGRSVIVRDIGAGLMGVATALDGDWYDKDGAAL